ncbi:MAG: hypothetical protein GY765_18170 [bacterium]|nr:hypothetical protein [bacterium]
MKTKRRSGQLALNKKTVTNLDSGSMELSRGGAEDYTHQCTHGRCGPTNLCIPVVETFDCTRATENLICMYSINFRCSLGC